MSRLQKEAEKLSGPVLTRHVEATVEEKVPHVRVNFEAEYEVLDMWVSEGRLNVSVDISAVKQGLFLLKGDPLELIGSDGRLASRRIYDGFPIRKSKEKKTWVFRFLLEKDGQR